jgi:hypothetical protein
MSVEILESLFCNNEINMRGGGMGNKENSALLKIVLTIVILFAIYSYFEYKNKSNTSQQVITTEIKNDVNTETPNQSNQSNQSNQPGYAKEIILPVKKVGTYGDIYPVLRDYDYRTYNDDLTPPRKRDDYDIPANVLYPDRFGLYTRGGPNPFKKMGYINNKNAQPGDPYKFLTLMGRQKYYNSNTYEYYIVSTNKEENLKFDLEKNKREIFTGDTVKVPQLNDTEYEANIDKVLDYEYNPFII